MAENTNPSGSAEDDAKGAIKKAISSVKNTIGGAVNIIKGGSLSDNADLATSISEGLLGLREKSYSEIVLDSIGVNIPLPSQSQVYNFYYELELSKGSIKENEKPINELAYLNPETWLQSQYLKYQSDYRYWDWSHVSGLR